MQESTSIEKEKEGETDSLGSSGQFYHDELAHRNQVYTTKQKIAMFGLVFFAMIVFILWLAQAREGLKKPFDYGSGVTDSQQTGQKTQDDRLKDTDKDGLSDYDERNIYHTSPYLEDSDSDGLSDKEEVMGNNNPNCAAGTDCFDELNDTIEKVPKNETISSPLVGEVGDSTSIQYQNSNSLLGGDVDPDFLRELLIKDGVDPRLINAITDDELMLMYQGQLEDINSSNQ